MLIGFAKGLNGWQKASEPKHWKAFTNVIGKRLDKEGEALLHHLQVTFGDGRAKEELEKLAFDGNGEPEARRQALRSLVASRTPDLAPQLFKLLGDRAMVGEAIVALASYEHSNTPNQILTRLRSFGPSERSAAIQTLASRPSYAKALMTAVRNQQIARSEISAFHARQIRSFDDEQLHRELAELWGEVRLSSEEKRKKIDEYRRLLTSTQGTPGDVDRGRGLFQKNCANCHVLFGAGRTIGPDLTGSNRKNVGYLLENIVDPSASVAVDFRTMVALLDDGQVINGVVVEQSERTLTLQTAQNPMTLDRRQIVKLKETENSLMPDGILQNLNESEIRDLFAYLMK